MEQGGIDNLNCSKYEEFFSCELVTQLTQEPAIYLIYETGRMPIPGPGGEIVVAWDQECKNIFRRKSLKKNSDVGNQL